MHRLKNVSVLAVTAFTLVACSDVADRSITAPYGPQLHYSESPEYKLALESEIQDGIRCLLDGKQETSKLSDFDAIILKADKGEDQAVTDFVNNFVKWASDLIKKKGMPAPKTADCGGRTPAPSLEVAAQELFNALFLYSGQYPLIETPPYPGNGESQTVFCPVGGCQYPAPGENSFATGAAIYVAPGTFPVPVLITWYPTTVTNDQNEPGVPVGDAYEFTLTPALTTAPPGWERYICIPHADYDAGIGGGDSFAMFRYDGTVWEQLDPGSQIIICKDPDEVSSSILLRGVTRVASIITKPFQPRLLWALQHRAIGGPAIAASPHRIRWLAAPPSEGCTTRSGWQTANAAGEWDFRSKPYPHTHLHSITVQLTVADGTTINARRLTKSGTGEQPLGFGTPGTPTEVPGGWLVTYTWPRSSVTPFGDVQFDVHNANEPVDFGTSGSADCHLQTFSGIGVAGELFGQAPTIE